MILLKLFTAFARVGVLTFGGGYAMIPMLEREIVDRHGWATSEELMDYYAVGQCTPIAGNLGGVVATLGVVFPSFVIISVIAGIIQNFADIPAVKSAFAAIRVCVCVLIFNSVLKLWKGAVKDKAALVLCLLVFVLSMFFNISPIVFVVFCALAGILFTRLGVRGK